MLIAYLAADAAVFQNLLSSSLSKMELIKFLWISSL